MKTGPCRGVVLAGGKGRRMSALGDETPKILLPILNRPLLAHHFDHLRSGGCREVLIALRSVETHVREAVEKEGRDLEVKLFTPESHLGIAHTLLALEDELNGPFMLILGDIDFLAEDLKGVTDRFLGERPGALLAVREEIDPDRRARNFTVVCGKDGRVIRVMEKARYHSSALMGVGVYWFGPEIFDAIRCTPRTALREEFELTEAIQILIDQGNRVEITRSIRSDTNITSPADLLACNLRKLRESGKRTEIDAGASVHPDARVEDAVIGAGARIEGPSEVRESLILPGATVPEGKPVHRAVVGKRWIQT